MYMALDVGKGRHSIKLEYHTPLLKEGICISVFAFFPALFNLCSILFHRLACYIQRIKSVGTCFRKCNADKIGSIKNWKFS